MKWNPFEIFMSSRKRVESMLPPREDAFVRGYSVKHIFPDHPILDVVSVRLLDFDEGDVTECEGEQDNRFYTGHSTHPSAPV